MLTPSAEDQTLLYEYLTSDGDFYTKLSPRAPEILSTACFFLMGQTCSARQDPLSLGNLDLNLIRFLDSMDLNLGRSNLQHVKLLAMKKLFDNWPGAEFLVDASALGNSTDSSKSLDFLVESRIVLSYLRAYATLRAAKLMESSQRGPRRPS